MPRVRAEDHITTPLIVVLGKLAGLWAIANGGYYLLLPVLGFSISYNVSPIAIAIYYMVWALGSVVYFWDLYSRWLVVDTRIWLYGVQSLLFAGFVWVVLYTFSGRAGTTTGSAGIRGSSGGIEIQINVQPIKRNMRTRNAI